MVYNIKLLWIELRCLRLPSAPINGVNPLACLAHVEHQEDVLSFPGKRLSKCSNSVGLGVPDIICSIISYEQLNHEKRRSVNSVVQSYLESSVLDFTF